MNINGYIVVVVVVGGIVVAVVVVVIVVVASLAIIVSSTSIHHPNTEQPTANTQCAVYEPNVVLPFFSCIVFRIKGSIVCARHGYVHYVLAVLPKSKFARRSCNKWAHFAIAIFGTTWPKKECRRQCVAPGKANSGFSNHNQLLTAVSDYYFSKWPFLFSTPISVGRWLCVWEEEDFFSAPNSTVSVNRIFENK